MVSINPRLTPTQRGKAAQQTEDAVARRFGLTDGLQLHKPGFRRVTDAAALERVQAGLQRRTMPPMLQAYKQTRDYNEHTGGDPTRTGAGAPAKGSGAPQGAYPFCSRRRQRLHRQRRRRHLGAPGQLVGVPTATTGRRHAMPSSCVRGI